MRNAVRSDADSVTSTDTVSDSATRDTLSESVNTVARNRHTNARGRNGYGR